MMAHEEKILNIYSNIALRFRWTLTLKRQFKRFRPLAFASHNFPWSVPRYYFVPNFLRDIQILEEYRTPRGVASALRNIPTLPVHKA